MELGLEPDGLAAEPMSLTPVLFYLPEGHGAWHTVGLQWPWYYSQRWRSNCNPVICVTCTEWVAICSTPDLFSPPLQLLANHSTFFFFFFNPRCDLKLPNKRL